MNLIGVQGLGGLGESSVVVGDTMTCMPNEQYQVRMDSYNDLVRQVSEAKQRRWYFVGGGVLLGALIVAVVKR